MRSATKTVASTFGVIVGLAGLEHGVGEVLQGNSAPPGLVFESWPDSRLLESMAGEPAMSVLPNLLVSGLLTIGLSLATILCAVALLRRRYGGLLLMTLSALLLLLGGGIVPPVMGLIVGAAATRISKPPKPRPAPGPGSRKPLPGRLWPHILVASVLGYLALLPGVPLLLAFASIESTELVAFLALFSLSTFLLAILAARVSDSYDARLAAPARAQ